MRIERFPLLSLACLPFLFFGCASKPDTPSAREFYFSSGGAYHLEGYGEWIITLAQDGNFAVTHNVNDKITEYGNFSLSVEENATLWALIDGANINGMNSSERLGMPDEVQYTLSLTEDGSRHEVQVWIGEAREHEALTKLVAQIGILIKTHTGQQPILK